ncbi:MAG: hypothetical protein Q9162_007492 [Coniocarpon cinnabarinum]
MSSTQHGTSTPILIQRPRGDRPHLLPFNRRLRHLRGVSFRNLAFATSNSRVRGQTIDDDAVPITLSSPAKLLALNETHELMHSRSSDNLVNAGKTKAGTGNATNGHPKTPFRKPQRRNTAEWLSAIHTEDVGTGAEPLYVSEVAETVMNHDFRAFDLDSYGVETSAASQCRIRFWARHDENCTWSCIKSVKLDLSATTYVGRTLDEFAHHLPDNFVFVHLSDGIYTADIDAVCPDDFETTPLSFETVPKPPKAAEATSSYDSLMRLSTLQACIQDALTTQAKLSTEISTLLTDDKARLSQSTTLDQARDQCASVDGAIATTRKHIASLKSSISHSRRNLHERREAIYTGRNHNAAFRADVFHENALTERKSALHNISSQLQGQRRRLCNDLSFIYPIEPSKTHNSPLAFAIRSLHLPNSAFNQPNLSAATTAAALGHIAHCVHHLSLYLSVLLPYPLQPRASTSTATDSTSLLPPSQSRTFPLHVSARSDDLAASSGSAAFGRFEYAVFLLNKNIEALTSRLGVSIMDIQQTLPNLKYVFLVATAGKGEVPKRWAGGVKGLARRGLGSAAGESSVESSRRGSAESVRSGGEAERAAEEVKKRLLLREAAHDHKDGETNGKKGKQRAD